MATLFRNNYAETTYPFRLVSANSTDEGWSIVRASEVGGHRTVATIDDLFELTIPVLSESTLHSAADGGGASVTTDVAAGADAIGQLWYVQSEGCFYQLISWENRKSIDGWKKFTAGGGAQLVLPINGVIETNYTLAGINIVEDRAEDYHVLDPVDRSDLGLIDLKNYGIYFYNRAYASVVEDSGDDFTNIPLVNFYKDLPHGCFIYGDSNLVTDETATYNFKDGAYESSTAYPAPSSVGDDSTVTPDMTHNYKKQFAFVKFNHSDLYAYNDEIEQIFIDPTGQAWKYDEDGTRLVHANFTTAFATIFDFKNLEKTVGNVDKKIDDRIAGLVDGAPQDMDTLKELSAAIKAFEGEGGKLDAFVPKTRTITANDGLTGGGDLSADVTVGIADNGVTTAKIADANVTTAKIADANVTTAKIASSAVTDAKIASSAVTTAKIADANVTDAKIASNAVTTAKIADANVTSAKLASDSVSLSKVAGDARSMFAVNALRFYKIAEGEDVRGLHVSTERQTSKITDFSILFSPHAQKFVYAHKEYANDDTSLAPSDMDSTGDPISADNNYYYTTFTFGDISSEMYMYEAGVEKRYVDSTGKYWIWNSNGTDLVEAMGNDCEEDIAALDAKVGKLNADVYAVQRSLPSISITGNYRVKNADGTYTSETASAISGNIALYGGQVAELSNLHYSWSFTNADTHQPFTLRTGGTHWSAAGEYNTDPTVKSFSTSTAGIAAKSTTLTTSATSVSITLGAPKVGLMVSNNKVVPATGSDTASKSIAASWTYARFWGTISSVPVTDDQGTAAEKWATAILNNYNNASTNAVQDKANREYVAANSKSKTITMRNNFPVEPDKSPTGNCHFFYAYPKSWGTLSKAILDGATPVFNTFERTEASITVNGYTVVYYIYYTPGTGGYTGGSVALS